MDGSTRRPSPGVIADRPSGLSSTCGTFSGSRPLPSWVLWFARPVITHEFMGPCGLPNGLLWKELFHHGLDIERGRPIDCIQLRNIKSRTLDPEYFGR